MLVKRTSFGDPANNGSNSTNGLLNRNKSTTVVKKFVPLRRMVPGSTTTTTTTTCGTPAPLQRSALVTPSIPKSKFVQRVSLFGSEACGPTANSIGQKKFQRPMVKRRAYGKQADVALQHCSLGQKRRFNSMDKILARAGRPLTYKIPNSNINTNTNNGDSESGSDDDDDDDDKEKDRPFEPLELWKSPHLEGGLQKGLPSQVVMEKRPDEFGIEEEVKVLKPAPIQLYSKNSVLVPAIAAKWLRPHQREGVKFMYECVMGLRDYNGYGCILADDMGLGKTLQSVTLIYTMLKTGITSDGAPTAKRVIVVCPCSLVKNWESEFIKWFGPGAVKSEVLADQSKKEVERSIDSFCKTKIKNVLIASYECIRMHADRLIKYKDCCDLLVCDEAHRLKNSDNQTSRALNSLPVRRRVLLTGTPMQNDLQEFYAMVDFTNPMILGSPEEFRRKVLFPVLRGREPDATELQKSKMMQIQNDMSTTVNDFILRRVNTLNAQHLPPKLVQVVCCNLTEIQQNMYQHLISSKDTQHLLDGKQTNCLAAIQLLMKLSNHPTLVAEDDRIFGKQAGASMQAANRRGGNKVVKYNDDPDKETQAVPGADGIARFLPCAVGGKSDLVHPEWSGKMYVLYRLMKEMRKPGNGGDKIVIISNYTQTLDLIGRMCRENSWGLCRLDGSVTMKKRQKMVEEFNDPSSSLVAFLLSSKAGGCGLNLIGANRLVLFDPDWNPAVDKQAAARCWRDGQKKRCFTYRFLATGTVEEKIFQRQLSKEGLQSIVDDKEQVNALSTKDLRNLFKLRQGTPSDTHDKLQCERCKIILDTAEMEAARLLPLKLARCGEILKDIEQLEGADHFLKELDPTKYGQTKDAYEKLVKQPIDFGLIKRRLAQSVSSASSYNSITGFSKDVNRIFGNVLKVWSPGDEIADIARRLQGIWMEKWTVLVPVLMSLKEAENGKDPSSDNLDDVDEVLATCATVNNERSDDYQEQIGMPDEENMRNWSHHYSTDTVDDPIFRAAIRGTDAVSFVFGLEVTWSLIQQRQQDEEERQAMLALECIQEEDNDSEEDAPRKPSKVAKSTIGIKSNDDSDDDTSIDSNPKTNGPQEEESDDEENTFDGNEVEPKIHPLKDSICSSNASDDCSSDDDLVLDSLAKVEKVEPTPKQRPQSSQEDKENIDPKDSNRNAQKWSCVSCTYVNKSSRKKCAVCGGRKD